MKILSLLFTLALPLSAHATFVPAVDPNCVKASLRSALPLVRYVGADPNPLLKDVAFAPRGSEAPLAEWPVIESWPTRIFEKSSLEERWEAISGFELNDLIAKAGHNPVRDPRKIGEIAESMAVKYIPAVTEADRPAINIVTNAAGEIRAVETIYGHHRFLAKMKLKAERVRDLNREELDIYVNGIKSDGTPALAKLPAHAIDFETAAKWPEVPDSLHPAIPTSRNPAWATSSGNPNLRQLIEQDRIKLRTDKGERSGELLLHPSLSNYQIGSRSTLGAVFRNLERDFQPRVGLRKVSTLPSFTEIERWVKSGLDEVVLVPPAARGDWESSVRAINLELSNRGVRTRLNIYQGIDYESYAGIFGDRSFRLRMRQIFNTTREIDWL